MPYIEARGSALYGPRPGQDVHHYTADLSMGGIVGAVRATPSTTTLTRVPAATRFIGRTSAAFPLFRSSGEESRAVRVVRHGIFRLHCTRDAALFRGVHFSPAVISRLAAPAVRRRSAPALRSPYLV